MKYEIILDCPAGECRPEEGMHPFSHVWQEKKSILTNGILVPSTVGIRCGGYFRFRGEGTISDALAALRYGLETACFHLVGASEIGYPPLFTQQTAEFLNEINNVLTESESPFRIEELAFAQMDWCVRNQNAGAGRYSGFIIGKTGTRQVTVYAPLGIEGEWQCVCGVYNEPRKRKCAKCKTARPAWKIKNTKGKQTCKRKTT